MRPWKHWSSASVSRIAILSCVKIDKQLASRTNSRCIESGTCVMSLVGRIAKWSYRSFFRSYVDDKPMPMFVDIPTIRGMFARSSRASWWPTKSGRKPLQLSQTCLALSLPTTSSLEPHPSRVLLASESEIMELNGIQWGFDKKKTRPNRHTFRVHQTHCFKVFAL